MDTKLIHRQILDLMPFKGDRMSPFPKRLKHALNLYCAALKEGGADGAVIKKAEYICARLQDIVKVSLNGLHSTAFQMLNNLFVGPSNKYRIDINATMLTIPPTRSFYRIRQMFPIFEIEPKELFHIPVNKRGIIKTQRYSVPGYPCLYLGESIYACWEEMRRPSMHDAAVVRLQNEKSINLIDLTIPTLKNLDSPEYLNLIPLIISCMIPVSDDANAFKTEYIIPQLLIEWVLKIKKLKGSDIHGIAYVSTHLSKEFQFPIIKSVNYAMPARDFDTNSLFSPLLCDIFRITSPTSNEIEKLKDAYGIGWGHPEYDEDKALEEHYQNSDFGHLEERLKDTVKFPLKKIDHITGEAI